MAGRRGRGRPHSYPFAPSFRARRAGTSRVRSVRGSRRAQRAVRTVGAFRARKGRRSASRRRANPGRTARAARLRRLSPAVSAPPGQFLRSPSKLGGEIAGVRDRLGVGAEDARCFHVAAAVGRRAPARGREQRRGEQGQRERPFQPLGEHRRPAANRRAVPLPPPRSARARARLASSNVLAATNGGGLAPAAQASAASIACCNASSPGRPKAATAIAGRRCPAGPAVSARQASSRRPAGPGSAPGRVRWSASRSAASSSFRPALAAAACSRGAGARHRAQGGVSRTIASSPASVSSRRGRSSVSRAWSRSRSTSPTCWATAASGSRPRFSTARNSNHAGISVAIRVRKSARLAGPGKA